jgi:hypothetical protein
MRLRALRGGSDRTTRRRVQHRGQLAANSCRGPAPSGTLNGEHPHRTASLVLGSLPTPVSTARGYQNALQLFREFITAPVWKVSCADRFGHVPAQILHEWNVVGHV